MRIDILIIMSIHEPRSWKKLWCGTPRLSQRRSAGRVRTQGGDKHQTPQSTYTATPRTLYHASHASSQGVMCTTHCMGLPLSRGARTSALGRLAACAALPQCTTAKTEPGVEGPTTSSVGSEAEQGARG
jgi:hypothetical protein